MTTVENLTRIDNDVNGNPRYVVHFLQIDDNYETALKKSRAIGGKKYHNKKYGGGIAFQSYNKEELVKDINELKTAK